MKLGSFGFFLYFIWINIQQASLNLKETHFKQKVMDYRFLFFLAYERTSVGIEEGIIMDDQLKSSNHPDDPHPAREGRLNFPGAWCGNTMRQQLYLQVDFLANFQGWWVCTDPMRGRGS